jgi:hypothetical protein
MATIFLLETETAVRAFDSLGAIDALPDVQSVKELTGGHAVASLSNGTVVPIRRVMLERGAGTSPDVFSPPPPVRRTDSALSQSALGLQDEDGTSPSLVARTSPIFSTPHEFTLRTPERKHGQIVCPGAPARVVRVCPKRFRGWGPAESLFAGEEQDPASPKSFSAASGAAPFGKDTV